MENFLIFQTKLGKIKITEANNAITGLNFIDNKLVKPAGFAGRESTPLLIHAMTQIEEYIAGKRKVFDIPLSYGGTEFQKRVMDVVQGIPYGEKWSYKQVAEALDSPQAAKAVGSAVNKNPLLIFIPCHRVVGNDGRLVGYSGGIDRKKKLLELERQVQAEELKEYAGTEQIVNEQQEILKQIEEGQRYIFIHEVGGDPESMNNQWVAYSKLYGFGEAMSNGQHYINMQQIESIQQMDNGQQMQAMQQIKDGQQAENMQMMEGVIPAESLQKVDSKKKTAAKDKHEKSIAQKMMGYALT